MIQWRYQQFNWSRNSEGEPQSVEAYLVGSGPKGDQIVTAGARVRWQASDAGISWSSQAEEQENNFIGWLETQAQYTEARAKISQVITG